MTPKQLDAIDALVAECIFGIKPNSVAAHVRADWDSPTRSWSAAGEVVERMNAKPRNISIAHSPITDMWLVMFLSYRREDNTFNVNDGGTAEHKDPRVAICLAAIRAVGAGDRLDAAIKENA